MSDPIRPIPEPCLRAQAAIELDPLELNPETAAHVRGCLPCAEARVAWLAQEETQALAPAGYFERLPERILSKLPSGPRRRRPHLILWALAAGLLLSVGLGGFWAGRANRQPMVEATLVQPAPDLQTLPDTPFLEGEDDYAQLPDLSPEQAHRLFEQVSVQAPRP